MTRDQAIALRPAKAGVYWTRLVLGVASLLLGPIVRLLPPGRPLALWVLAGILLTGAFIAWQALERLAWPIRAHARYEATSPASRSRLRILGGICAAAGFAAWTWCLLSSGNLPRGLSYLGMMFALLLPQTFADLIGCATLGGPERPAQAPSLLAPR